MMTRRDFVVTSLAGSAGLLSGCGKEDTPPAAANPASTAPAQPRSLAGLDLYFVGGTAFKKVGTGYVAIQLRGKGIVHDGHPMDHRSYLVAPYGTFGREGKQFPAGYDMTKLHPNLTLPPSSYEAVCLVGKDITVTQVTAGKRSATDPARSPTTARWRRSTKGSPRATGRRTRTAR